MKTFFFCCIGLAGGLGEQVWIAKWFPDFTRQVYKWPFAVCTSHSSSSEVSNLIFYKFGKWTVPPSYLEESTVRFLDIRVLM